MTISQKDIKLLWGRSGNRCAMPDCRTKLSQDSHNNGKITVGEQAHIVAAEPNGPRGQSPLSLNERDSYHNLILMCPTHHAIIDKDPQGFPLETLYYIKSQHELWVEEILSGDVVKEEHDQIIYSDLIDSIVILGNLEQWNNISASALEVEPLWPADYYEKCLELRKKIIGAVWPGTNEELEKSMKTLSIALINTAALFERHCKPAYNNKYLLVDRFYSTCGYDPLLYEKFRDWINAFEIFVCETTAAANWFASVVRRDINPLFFATKGKFMTVVGPTEDNSYQIIVQEWDDVRKTQMPELLNTEIRDKLQTLSS